MIKPSKKTNKKYIKKSREMIEFFSDFEEIVNI
jgi:hypothetical protein